MSNELLIEIQLFCGKKILIIYVKNLIVFITKMGQKTSAKWTKVRVHWQKL